MIEEIIAGISSKIFETFGSDYEIYADKMSQNVKEPCFLISPLNHFQKTRLCNSSVSRYYREYPFCIFFYPKRDGDQYAENQLVAEKLYECLEYIETDVGKLRGSGMRYSIEDKDLLNFIVKYSLFVKRDSQAEIPDMGTVDAKIVTEGENDG